MCAKACPMAIADIAPMGGIADIVAPMGGVPIAGVPIAGVPIAIADMAPMGGVPIAIADMAPMGGVPVAGGPTVIAPRPGGGLRHKETGGRLHGGYTAVTQLLKQWLNR